MRYSKNITFMTESSYKNWNAMSDKALTQHLGAYIKHQRTEQSRTQTELATAAGISRSTLSLLERGETVTLATFIQVLRVLDSLYLLDAFTVHENISPMMLAEQEAKYNRKRVRNKK